MGVMPVRSPAVYPEHLFLQREKGALEMPHASYSWLLTADPHIWDETLFLTKLDLCRRPPSAGSSREVAPSSSLGICSVLR